MFGTISTTADASGAFALSALLSVGANNISLTASDAAGNTSSASSKTITRLDLTTSYQVALDWNSAALNTISLDGSQPPVASRSLAMVSSAMYDAVNSVNGASSFLYAHVPAPQGSSDIAAVAQAAHDALLYLYPAQQAAFDAQLAVSLSAVAAGGAKTNGIAVGQQVAAAIIAQRANDGSTDYVDYTPGSGPGIWQPTYPMYASALLPNWATLEPFLMNSDSQFRPSGARTAGNISRPQFHDQTRADRVAGLLAKAYYPPSPAGDLIVAADSPARREGKGSSLRRRCSMSGRRPVK